MLFVGDDWAEDHHDVELQDEPGRVVKTARLNSEKTSEPRRAVLSLALIALLCRRHLSKVRTGFARSRPSRSRCIYGCDTVCCSRCLRRPYGVTPCGLYTASVVATSNTSRASAA